MYDPCGETRPVFGSPKQYNYYPAPNLNNVEGLGNWRVTWTTHSLSTTGGPPAQPTTLMHLEKGPLHGSQHCSRDGGSLVGPTTLAQLEEGYLNSPLN